MNEADLCEVCEEHPAVTGVKEVKLCTDCFDSIAEGKDSEHFAKFLLLAESRAQMAQKRLAERAERIKEAEATGATHIVSACPFCETSLQLAIERSESKLKMVDLIQFVEESLK